MGPYGFQAAWLIHIAVVKAWLFLADDGGFQMKFLL